MFDIQDSYADTLADLQNKLLNLTIKYYKYELNSIFSLI